MGKVKTEQVEESGDVVIKEEELSYNEKIELCSAIAKPMASKKLAKKCYKLIKKAQKHKTYLRTGVKDVQKMLRKGETGIVVFAGDVAPIEIMCHLPAVCEDRNIPYVYTPSRQDLGGALGLKRGCLMALIKTKEDYQEAFDECKEEITHLGLAL